MLVNTIIFLGVVGAVTTVIAMNLFFNIAEINVAGLTRYKADEIIAATNISVGENIFAVDTEGIEAQLYEKYPYFASVSVRRLIPDKIEIVVTEGRPQLAFINSADSYTVVGDHNRVIEQGKGPYLDISTKVVGLGLGHLPVGYSITDQSLRALEAQAEREQSAEKRHELEQQYLRAKTELDMLSFAKRLQQELKRAEISEVTYIDIESNMTFKFFYDHRILVDFGTELDIAYRLKFLKQVTERLGDRFRGTVDMSVFSMNSRVYAREQSVYQLLDAGYRGMYL